MTETPSREVLLERVLRNLSRRETPMRYVVVQRLRNYLFNMSDPIYERFIHDLLLFDPNNIDPKVKSSLIADLERSDESGALAGMAKAALEDPVLLAEGKRILTNMTT